MLYRLALRSDRPQGLADSVVVAGTVRDGWWDWRADGRLQASIGRALALGCLAEFRRRLYGCLTGRADALFELVDAILCADRAVTSLVELSLEPEFRRGHGALYDALAAGSIDSVAFADLLAGFLPMSGPPRRPVPAGDAAQAEDLAQALAVLPPEQARAVAEACLPKGGRLRFAIDGTPDPRPDAECSPGRWHVHHDACRCDGTRKTIPGWEYQFVTALGQLRSAWTALTDVARTTHGTRLAVTAGQIRALIGRLERTGQAGADMPVPIVVLDAGYPATALTAALRGVNAHLVVRLPAKNVYYRDPITWPGKNGRPPTKFGQRIKCADVPNPEPDEELILPDTSAYGTVAIACWRHVHPQIHGDRGYFADWDGDLPIIKGDLVRVQVQHLPDGRAPHNTLWLWHAGPAAPEGIKGPHGHGYYPDSTGTPRDMHRFNASWGNGAGGVVSTTHDVSTFQRAFNQGRLLPPSLQKVITAGPRPSARQSTGRCGDDLRMLGGLTPGNTTLTFFSTDGRRQFAISVTQSTTDDNAILDAMNKAGEAVLCPAA